MPAHFESGEKFDAKTGHLLPAGFENFRFENGNLTGTFGNNIVLTLENDENRTFLDAFGTRLVDSYGLGIFLWHQNLQRCFYLQNSYRFQIVAVNICKTFATFARLREILRSHLYFGLEHFYRFCVSPR